MSHRSRKFAQAALVGLMLGIAPFGSAIGQETAPVANSITPAPAPAVVQPTAPADGPSLISAAAAAEVDAARERMEAEAREVQAIEEQAAALKPGKYLWQPERAPEGETEMVVSIADQKAYVYRAGKLIGVTTVSTGKRGHRTPTGSFTILEKRRKHFSNLYNNAPMPNMQRLTWTGIALHAGALPGYPASHGCVRLPMEFSKLLFGATQLGGRVHIVADAAPSAAEALAFATGKRGMQMASAR
jgi:lipoprotein-anchoring transpeptidase ErfK/SrfK